MHNTKGQHGDGVDMMRDPDSEEEDKKGEEENKISKKKLKKQSRLTVAELKQIVNRPDLVEMHDVTAMDPKLLVLLKSTRNSGIFLKTFWRKDFGKSRHNFQDFFLFWNMKSGGTQTLVVQKKISKRKTRLVFVLYNIIYSAFPNVSHVLEEMFAYAQPTHLIFGTVKNIEPKIKCIGCA